jgi:hypothetical protein
MEGTRVRWIPGRITAILFLTPRTTEAGLASNSNEYHERLPGGNASTRANLIIRPRSKNFHSQDSPGSVIISDANRYATIRLYFEHTMGTDTAIPGTLLNAQDVSSLRLPNQSMAYLQRWFIRTIIGLLLISSIFINSPSKRTGWSSGNIIDLYWEEGWFQSHPGQRSHD